MLRSFFIFILLSVALFSTGQSDTLKGLLSKAACECFENIRKAKSFEEEAFGDCLSSALEENLDLFSRECFRIYGDSSEETAYKFGRSLFDSIKITLVDDCYDYFIIMDSLHRSAFAGVNEDSLKKELHWFNSTSKAPDSSTFYSDRGVLKLQLKDYNGAYYDLEKAVKLKEDNIAAHLFRGWVLEIKKEYAKAVTDFLYVAKATGDDNYLMLAAIAARKKRMAEGGKK